MTSDYTSFFFLEMIYFSDTVCSPKKRCVFNNFVTSNNFDNLSGFDSILRVASTSKIKVSLPLIIILAKRTAEHHQVVVRFILCDRPLIDRPFGFAKMPHRSARLYDVNWNQHINLLFFFQCIISNSVTSILHPLLHY